MARKTTNGSPRPRSFSPKEAARQLRQFHRAGAKSLKRHPQRLPSGQAQAKADEAGMPLQSLNKARIFADPARGYGPEELQRLIDTCRGGPYPITPTHVGRLISVPRAQRRRLARKVAGEGWSAQRLDLEIRRIRRREPRNDPSRVHGRPFKPPADADELVGEALAKAERWRAWYAALCRPQAQGDGKPIDLLPEPLRRELKAADTKLRRVIEAAEDMAGG